MDDKLNFRRVEVTEDLYRKIWIEGLAVQEQDTLARWKWVVETHNRITHHIVAKSFKFISNEKYVGWSDETAKCELPIPSIGGELLFFKDRVVGYDPLTSYLRKKIRADKMYRGIPKQLQLIEIDRRSVDERADAARVHATVFGIKDGLIEMLPEHPGAVFKKYYTDFLDSFEVVVESYYNNTSMRSSARGVSVFYNRIQTVEKYADLLRKEIEKYIPGHGLF